MEDSGGCFAALTEKVRSLDMQIELLKYAGTDKENNFALIRQMEQCKIQMKYKVSEMQKALIKGKKLMDDMRVLERESSHIVHTIDEVHKILGSNPKIVVNQASLEPCCIVPADNTSGQQFGSASPIEGSDLIHDSETPAVTPFLSRENLHVKRTFLTFELMHISQEEFADIPGYMKGRYLCESINSFIDVINGSVARKYRILSKSKESLNTKDLALYRIYKKNIIKELKGKRYVTEQDIARELNRNVLEKKLLIFLTIIRHTKRISEYRQAGCTKVYVLS